MSTTLRADWLQRQGTNARRDVSEMWRPDAFPPYSDAHLVEAWERMTTGGVQVVGVSPARKGTDPRRLETEIAACLSPTNENVARGDWVAALRDIRQILVSSIGTAKDAIARLEQAEHERDLWKGKCRDTCTRCGEEHPVHICCRSESGR